MKELQSLDIHVKTENETPKCTAEKVRQENKFLGYQLHIFKKANRKPRQKVKILKHKVQHFRKKSLQRKNEISS